MAHPPIGTVLEREREATIRRLGDGFAADAIGEDELERRLELAERADSVAALHALTADLGDFADPGPLVAPGSPPTALARRPSADEDDVTLHDRRIAILSDQKQTGVWTPPRVLTSFTLFGATELDFRQAALAPGMTEIELHAFLGDVEIVVPPGLPVEVACASVLASITVDPDVGAPTSASSVRLRVTGMAVLADVKVQQRLAGESAKDAKRRRKAERKALKAARRG
jgi:hypothetical protein